MKEKEFISTIKNILNSNYIGDDCAYLKDLGIVVTQDSLIEDVHFSFKYTTPYQLGYKSVMVNLSDIVSSGGNPKYLTISISLPKKYDTDFISEFYNGAKYACPKGVEIVGGDITGGDKVFISICAIGKTEDRKISSRKNAKIGYKVVVAGLHGSSAGGLKLLLTGENTPQELINAHLMPKAQFDFGENISKNIKTDYAMMDTSDGLMDTLSTIANESKVLLNIDFQKIPYDKNLEFFKNYKEMILFGGEDYGIVAIVPEDFDCGGSIIGTVSAGLGVNLTDKNNVEYFSKKDVEQRVFNHFG
jgi:thiamine-monophosphate kinase